MKTARLETAGIVLGFTGVLIGQVIDDTNMIVVGAMAIIVAILMSLGRRMAERHAELMDVHTLRETCSCGASIQVPRDVEISTDFLAQWRDTHRKAHHTFVRS